MKKYKIVPGYSMYLGKCFRIYKRWFLIFWIYEATEETLERAEDIINHLERSERYL